MMLSAMADDFYIDSISFDHQLYMDCESCSHPIAHYSIPKVITDNPQLLNISNSINEIIYKELDYGDDLDRWTWNYHDVDFRYEFESPYLLLSIDYIFFGAHGEFENQSTLLFDLRTGERVKLVENIPFSALFSTEGYFDFLNGRKWSEGVYETVIEAYMDEASDSKTKCDSIEAYYMSKYGQFHIDYCFSNGKFNFWRENNCYSIFCWAHRCFEPSYIDECPIDSVLPYMNEIGKSAISLAKMKYGVSYLLSKNELFEKIEDYLFLEIETQENSYEEYLKKSNVDENKDWNDNPIQIALNYQNPQSIEGILYIDGKKERITGKFESDVFYLHSTQSDWTYSFSKKDLENVTISNPKENARKIVGYTDKNEYF